MSKPRTHNHILLAGVIAVLLVALSGGASAAPLAEQSSGTAFTYQGQLTQTGEAVNGTCNFAFALWDDAGAGNQVGSTLNQTLPSATATPTATATVTPILSRTPPVVVLSSGAGLVIDPLWRAGDLFKVLAWLAVGAVLLLMWWYEHARA